MESRTTRITPGIGLVALAGILIQRAWNSTASAQRQMEPLGRGVVAVPQDDGKVFVGWRLLGTDPDDIAFNLYRSTPGVDPVKLNSEPIRGATNFVDAVANRKAALSYSVRPVRGGRETEEGALFTVPSGAPARPYLSIPLQTLPGHTPNDASVGDLDGAGKSLLHNAMIVFGSGNADANRHTHDNLPVVLAGGGGGTLTPGRHVKHGSKPLTNLYLSMADKMGLREVERFGDSDGRLGNV